MDNPTIFDKILAVASFEELSDRGSLQAGRSILGVIKVIQELCLESDGYRVVFNSGIYGQQSVDYVHAHILRCWQMTWPPEQKKTGWRQRSMRSSRRSKWDRQDDELRAVNQRLTSVLASIDDLVFVLDSEGCYVEYYQPADKPELYAPPDEFLGKHITEVGMPESTVQEHLKAIKRVRETGQP